MVLRVPDRDLDVRCGGVPLQLDPGQQEGEPEAGFDGGTLVGKRYNDADDTMEFLCTRGGAGSLSVDGTLLEQKLAKKLPSSD